ncbi:DUF2285 domain-containing protein [Methylocella silvestris]|uniref:DUF2285 domain-containing protein n=1 Tax=Methylocella silvestris TaxID=199596 RepID=UPI003D7C146B
MLTPAPPGFDTVAVFDPAVLGPVLADHIDADGRKVTIGTLSGELHIWLQDADAASRPAVILPVDSMFDLRLDIALRLVRRLRGRRISLMPRALHLTLMQKARLIQLLHAFDLRAEGGKPRDVATEVLGATVEAALPSIEWKSSAARRKANRLIRDSAALVNGGYLRLLRGG